MAPTIKQVNTFVSPREWGIIDDAFTAVVARKGVKDGNGKRLSKNSWLKSILMKEARAELRRVTKDDASEPAEIPSK
jgi:hypothetical protein